VNTDDVIRGITRLGSVEVKLYCPPKKQIKVRVIDRWRVVHPDDGTGHVKDDALVVPENVVQEWERCGYVERVTGKS